jgi:hypothetical protein
MNPVRTIVLVAAALSLVVSTAQAGAPDDMYRSYYCWMEGSQVVPPARDTRQGGGCFYLSETDVLTYTINLWEPLVGLEVEAHIHGPAAEGMNAPVVFTLPPADQFGWHGELGPLTAQQLHDLGCGLWYVDVHTTAYPDGEVRGQFKALISGGAPNPCLLPVEGTTWGAVKSLYR